MMRQRIIAFIILITEKIKIFQLHNFSIVNFIKLIFAYKPLVYK